MSYSILTIPNFDKELKRLAKKYRSIKDDIAELAQELEINPTLGDEVIEHCYKIRMAIASKNKGKRGGARVITYVYVAVETVFLLSIYDKSEQDDISTYELRKLIEYLEIEDE